MNTVSKLALLAVFGRSVSISCEDKSDTNEIPVPDECLSSECSFDTASEEDSSETTKVSDQNTLDNIERQLDALEKRLLNDHNPQDALTETDLKLPMLVIDSFSKIFHLWQTNLVLKNSIESKKFYDIFSLMFRSLNEEPTTNDEPTGENTDLSNLTGVCDICDEEFELIENDVKKSFAVHERSAVHIEAMDLFNKIGASDETFDDNLKQTITNDSHNENNIDQNPTEKSFYMKRKEKDNKADVAWKQNRYFLKLSDEKATDFECYLCDIVRINRKNMTDHCNSKTHQKHRSYFLSKFPLNLKTRAEFNDDLIFSREQYFYCVLCQCIHHKQYRDKHVISEYHIGWKNFARKIIKLDQPYIRKVNQENVCFCELCNIKFNMMNSIIPHCQTKNHISLKRFADEIRCLLLKYRH